MKIGFDVSQTEGKKAGCGYFAYSLIQELKSLDSQYEYMLYHNFSDKTDFGCPDIIHANNFFFPTADEKSKVVYTLYDLSFIENPLWSTEANRTFCFDGVFNAALNADHIIAISEYTKKHFLEIFPHFAEEKISVIYPATRFSNIKLGKLKKPSKFSKLTAEKFWLSVGTIEPRKNYVQLLNAYEKLKSKDAATFPLVIAGGQGWLMHDFEKQIEQRGLKDNVIITGYLKDAELEWLYQNCYAHVYPSVFEGFGLPVLEAMSLGAPVISSNSSSLPEIVADAGILVDPYDMEDICEAMYKLSQSTEYRNALQEKALEQAKKFSWRKTAQQVVEIYERVI